MPALAAQLPGIVQGATEPFSESAILVGDTKFKATEARKHDEVFFRRFFLSSVRFVMEARPTVVAHTDS